MQTFLIKSWDVKIIIYLFCKEYILNFIYISWQRAYITVFIFLRNFIRGYKELNHYYIDSCKEHKYVWKFNMKRAS